MSYISIYSQIRRLPALGIWFEQCHYTCNMPLFIWKLSFCGNKTAFHWNFLLVFASLSYLHLFWQGMAVERMCEALNGTWFAFHPHEICKHKHMFPATNSSICWPQTFRWLCLWNHLRVSLHHFSIWAFAGVAQLKFYKIYLFENTRWKMVAFSTWNVFGVCGKCRRCQNAEYTTEQKKIIGLYC